MFRDSTPVTARFHNNITGKHAAGSFTSKNNSMHITDIHISIASFDENLWFAYALLPYFLCTQLSSRSNDSVYKVYQSHNWKEAFVTFKRTVSCLYCSEWQAGFYLSFDSEDHAQRSSFFFCSGRITLYMFWNLSFVQYRLTGDLYAVIYRMSTNNRCIEDLLKGNYLNNICYWFSGLFDAIGNKKVNKFIIIFFLFFE